MMKLAGAVFVWLGCALCGVQAAANLSRHTRLLESLVCALEQMERELVLSHLPMPELLERVEMSTSGPAAQLFAVCGRLLKQEYSFAHAWAGAVEEMELPQEELTCLSGLGTLLGRFEAEEQGKSVNRVRRELEQWVVRARECQRAYGRVYGMLGITAGSFLVIVLV